MFGFLRLLQIASDTNSPRQPTILTENDFLVIDTELYSLSNKPLHNSWLVIPELPAMAMLSWAFQLRRTAMRWTRSDLSLPRHHRDMIVLGALDLVYVVLVIKNGAGRTQDVVGIVKKKNNPVRKGPARCRLGWKVPSGPAAPVRDPWACPTAATTSLDALSQSDWNIVMASSSQSIEAAWVIHSASNIKES